MCIWTAQLANGMMHQGRQSTILNVMAFETRGQWILSRHGIVIPAPIRIWEVTNSFSKDRIHQTHRLRGLIPGEYCITALAIRYDLVPAHLSHSVIRSYYNIQCYTRVGTLIVATIYLQLIQNRYMFRSFTVLQCNHQHCVQPLPAMWKS